MATKKKMDLLTAVEQIVDKAKGSGLSSEFYRKADKYIKYMSESLLITTARNCSRRKHAEEGSECKLFTDGVGSKRKCSNFAESSRTMEKNKIIIYQTEDGQTQIDVRLENETVWLTQAQMAELFQTDRTSIVRHINNIYKVEELDRESTCAKIAQVQIEGKRTVRRNIPYFNLDMIISVGYRVNSKRGVRFRQWANKILKDYLIKGYAMNERIRKEQIGELRLLVGMLGRTSPPPCSSGSSTTTASSIAKTVQNVSPTIPSLP